MLRKMLSKRKKSKKEIKKMNERKKITPKKMNAIFFVDKRNRNFHKNPEVSILHVFSLSPSVFPPILSCF